jgi:hypothetical protein
MNILIRVMKTKFARDWIAKLVLWTTQCTLMEKGAHESLICLVTHVLPPWKTFTPSIPKHKSFLDKSFFVKPPPLNNAAIITSVMLLEPHPSITLSIDTKIGNVIQQSTNICMHTNPRPVVNCCNLVIGTCCELGRLYGFNSSILDLHIHEFNNDLTSCIRPMHGGIVGDA